MLSTIKKMSMKANLCTFLHQPMIMVNVMRFLVTFS